MLQPDAKIVVGGTTLTEQTPKSELAMARYSGDALACTIVGTRRNDLINGTRGNDVICALDGNDVVAGGAGDDIIFGGPGNDIIFGGAGAVRSSADRTTISSTAGPAPATSWGGRGRTSSWEAPKPTCSMVSTGWAGTMSFSAVRAPMRAPRIREMSPPVAHRTPANDQDRASSQAQLAGRHEAREDARAVADVRPRCPGRGSR